MAFKLCDPSPKTKQLQGEQAIDVSGSLVYKIHQMKRLIEVDRTNSIKKKLEENKKVLDRHSFQLVSVTSKRNALCVEQTGLGAVLSLRMKNPPCIFSAFSKGALDKDHCESQEVVSSTHTVLPYIEKIPPYTTWIFLDRNQRMADDQSVVGRRRIYYDHCSSEALICSDSEEEIAEPEEEKYEFTEGEDRIIWMAFEEHGLHGGILNVVSQFIGGTSSEIQERYSILKEKHAKKQNPNSKSSREFAFEESMYLEKGLGASLETFDSVFCRRCLVFDCRLHGCSQSTIIASEKPCNLSEIEYTGKPCSDQCYLHLREVKDLPEPFATSALRKVDNSCSVEKDGIPDSSHSEVPGADDSLDKVPTKAGIAEETTRTAEIACDAEAPMGPLNSNPSTTDEAVSHCGSVGKRKVLKEYSTILHDLTTVSDDSEGSSNKKQKKLSAIDVDAVAFQSTPSQDFPVADDYGFLMTSEKAFHESIKSTSKKSICHVSVEVKDNDATDATDATKLKETKCPSNCTDEKAGSCRWKPFEKELYLKGVEIFGRNSCLISRNLLSGLKTCIEVSSYMYGDGSALTHRSVAAPNSLSGDSGKAETDYQESEMPTRSRILRRRGKARKLKYSWKSAGHPSILKRISGGKNLSCKQYTPCECHPLCGKQCPCLDNGTCCEKYCGCSKSCKNRFRGCHCAKSQCRSRQCPCFAAGRECDPDVCRNCWVSCGDGTLGEPPKRGDGHCGNMRLLLRQQQRILLAKSDVAGWGAFLKSPVNKNDYLGEYTGELISHREADKRGKIYDRANSSFLFDLNDQYVLDAYRKGDKLKFANHSSNPNCYAKVILVAGDHRVGIFAKEHIEACEELFYDYRYGPDQAPEWARKRGGFKRGDDPSVVQGRAKKQQSHC